MRVYRVGTTYIDLEHVLSIDDPIMTKEWAGGYGYFMAIKVQLAFIGSHEIMIPIEGSSSLSVETQSIEGEFNRMKNDIWQNFFDAWITKSIIT